MAKPPPKIAQDAHRVTKTTPSVAQDAYRVPPAKEPMQTVQATRIETVPNPILDFTPSESPQERMIQLLRSIDSRLASIEEHLKSR